jgi:hypothetical protein
VENIPHQDGTLAAVAPKLLILHGFVLKAGSSKISYGRTMFCVESGDFSPFRHFLRTVISHVILALTSGMVRAHDASIEVRVCKDVTQWIQRL